MVRSRFRVGSALLTIFLSAGALAGCSSSGSTSKAASTPDSVASSSGGAAAWQATLDAANKEGAVTVYSSALPATLQNLKAAFEKQYPQIKLTVVNGSTADLEAKASAELDAGSVKADLVETNTGDAFWSTYQSKGDLLAPQGPSFANPKYDKSKFQPTGTWFGTQGGLTLLSWNTKAYPQGLTSFDDLLNSNLAGGKVGLVDPSVAPIIAGYYEFVEKQAGSDFFSKLGKQKPQIYPGTPAEIAALGSGAIAAAMWSYSTATLPAIATGAPIKYVVTSSPWALIQSAGILKGNPHPNAAQVLADFYVSPIGQAAVSQQGVSVLPGTAGTLAEPGAVTVGVTPISSEAQAFIANFQKAVQH